MLSADTTSAPPAALEATWSSFWPLDPSYDFLNHGSFGSVPRPVQAAQLRYRDLVEARPIEVLGRQCRSLLTRARERAARFVGADPNGLGFVTNATEGVNSVLRSFAFRPGDVLLTTNHVYNAVKQAMTAIARKAGAEVRTVDVPLPLRSPAQVTSALIGAMDGRTRLVIVDHITSPTAVVFPVADIARACRERGIACLVDGAHAPGMLDLRVEEIGATAYTGNFHKWVCAPKGCAFLWAAQAIRGEVHPATVSHFLDQGFDVEFDWQGTRDISAWLAIEDAIGLWEPLGWKTLREHNHAMAAWVQRLWCERWGVQPCTPLDGSMIGSMAAVPLPDGFAERYGKAEDLQAILFGEHRIEIPIVDWGGRWHARASCQAYNRPEQYERLADLIAKLREQL